MTEIENYELIINVIGVGCTLGFVVGILLSTFGNDKWYK